MQLQGIRVAAMVADGFEQVELTGPVEALLREGAEVRVIAPRGPTVRGWNHTDWGDPVAVDETLDQADAGRYDALLLPGGVLSPDKLRVDERALAFTRDFAAAGKPIAAICHGPWTLINAGVVQGRTLTSYHSIRLDLQNAGAHWVDREVCTDGRLISSRSPDDIPAFCRAIVELFGEAGGRERAVGEGGAGQVSEAPGSSFAAGAGPVGDNSAALAGNWLGNNSYPKGNTRDPDDSAPPAEGGPR